jgi:ABC transport system ATP-binding/permease protein
LRYRLVHVSGSLAGRVREMESREVVLGRDPALAQVVFGPEERAVSRRHAALRVENDTLLLRDLESRSGTFVAGHDIEEAELRDGDEFQLGVDGPRLRVEWSDAAGTLVVPAPDGPAGPPVVVDRALAVAEPGTRLRFTFLSGARDGSFVEAAGAVVRLGRAAGNTVYLPDDRIVSDQHAKVVRVERSFVLMDLESTNGTFLNGHRIERAALADGDVIGLGPGGPQLRLQVLAPDLAERSAQATIVIPGFAELARRTRSGSLVHEVPLPVEPLTLGRGPDAGLRLDSPIVSRAHARLATRQGALAVEDLGSANGTFHNGERVSAAALHAGDRLVIGPFVLEIGTTSLRVLDTRNRARLDANGLRVAVGARAILDDVSLHLPPGSFTALIGPSGAGKSTLLRALSGARPADAGHVTLNATDLYTSFEALKSSLGLVPQEDVVHRELTVAQSLAYTARLRLPPDTTQAERRKRIAEVLATLELTERAGTPIHRLSGGQRKRVSIAAELITEPALLFLDEPTSGLDPGLEEALMLLLRELSYKGKTVVLVTHTLDNIHLCDGIVLLVDGRLAFHGSAVEARGHFGIDHMVNLYARLKERSALEWQAAFRAGSLYAERVETPLAGAPAAAPRREALPGRSGAGSLRQLAILTSRYFKTLTRDARNALFLVVQAPLIAALIGLSLLYGRSDIAFTKPKNTILFLLALTAVWFGCSNAARELVKERAIYLRERMANLRVLPYLLSKVLVLLGLAAIQCVLFLVILDCWFGVPGSPVLLFGGMLLASLVGILLGLALSAVVATPDRAMTLLPILLIPQVLFTIPSVQMDMKGPAGLIARAMPTWWSYDLLRRVALAPDQAQNDDAMEARLEGGGPALMRRARFESMLQDGYPMFNYRSVVELTWTASWPEELAAQAGWTHPAAVDAIALGAFGTLLLAAAADALRRLDRRLG